MEQVRFEEVPAEQPLAAPQGPGTNALVHNPFAWEDDAAE